MKVQRLRHLGQVIFAIVVLTGCKALAVQEGIPKMGVPGTTALADTATAMLTEADVEALLIEAGDPSDTIRRGKILDSAPEFYIFLPEADARVVQTFERNGVTYGSVGVSFYKATYIYEQAIGEVSYILNRTADTSGVQIQVLSDIGESAKFLPPTAESASHLLLSRCHTVTYLFLEPDSAATETILSYVKDLDALISSRACQ